MLRKSTSADKRFESWCRDSALWQHVDKHLERCQWPLKCPHPRCDASLTDGQDLRFHLIDDHGLSRTLPKGLKHLCIGPSPSEQGQVRVRKRKIDKDNIELSWLSDKQFSPTHPPKTARKEQSTITPALLLCTETLQDPPPVIDLTALESKEIGAPLDREDRAWLPDDAESGSKSPIRFGSCGSTLVGSAQHGHDDGDRNDYCDFLQYIRSPSPDCVSTTDGGNTTAVDECQSPRSLDSSARASSSLSCLNSGENHQQHALSGTSNKLRIRLRIEAPKPKIMLRLPVAEKKKPKQQRSKPLRQPKRQKASSKRAKHPQKQRTSSKR